MMSERLRSRDPNSNSNKCYSIFFEDGSGASNLGATRSSDMSSIMRADIGSGKKNSRGDSSSSISKNEGNHTNIEKSEDNKTINSSNSNDDNYNHETHNILRSNNKCARELNFEENCGGGLSNMRDEKFCENVKNDKIVGDLNVVDFSCGVGDGGIGTDDDNIIRNGNGCRSKNNFHHENDFPYNTKYSISTSCYNKGTSSSTNNIKKGEISSIPVGCGGERKRKYEDFLKDDDDYDDIEYVDGDKDDYHHLQQNNIPDEKNIFNEKATNSDDGNIVPDNFNSKKCEDKKSGMENIKKEAPVDTTIITTTYNPTTTNNFTITHPIAHPALPPISHSPKLLPIKNISTKMNEIKSSNKNEKRSNNAVSSSASSSSTMTKTSVVVGEHYQNEANNNYTENIEMRKIKYEDANSELMFQVRTLFHFNIIFYM